VIAPPRVHFCADDEDEGEIDDDTQSHSSVVYLNGSGDGHDTEGEAHVAGFGLQDGVDRGEFGVALDEWGRVLTVGSYEESHFIGVRRGRCVIRRPALGEVEKTDYYRTSEPLLAINLHFHVDPLAWMYAKRAVGHE